MKKLPRLSPNDLVEVILDDLTTHDDGWEKLTKGLTRVPAVIHAAGYYLSHDERALKICFMTIPEDDDVGTIATIPLGAIKQVRKLK